MLHGRITVKANLSPQLLVNGGLQDPGYASSTLQAAIKLVMLAPNLTYEFPLIHGYLEENPKDVPLDDSQVLLDAIAMLYGKAIEDGVAPTEEIANAFTKVLGTWETVYTGEIILFLVQFLREYNDGVGVTDASFNIVGKALTDGASVPDVVGLLIGKPINDAVTATEATALLNELAKSDSVTESDFYTLANILSKNDATSIADAFDRVVQFVNAYQEAATMTDGYGIDYSTPISESALVVLDTIIVGLLYLKTYNDVVQMNIQGDVLNSSLLGSFTANASIGGEFISFLLQNQLVDALDGPTDLFDRVVTFFTQYQDAVISGDVSTLQFFQSSTDSVAMLDVLDRVVQFSLAFADAQTFADAVSFATARQFDDAATPSDAFDRIVSFVLAYADAVTTTDLINQFDVGLVKTDAATSADVLATVTSFNNGFLDAQGASETSMTAVLSSTKVIPATLDQATLNALPLNKEGSVSSISNYTFI